MSIPQQNQNLSNGQKPIHYDQIMQENLTLKYEITNLQTSLTETQIYSKTAYETFQILREKYGNEKFRFFFIFRIIFLFYLKKQNKLFQINLN